VDPVFPAEHPAGDRDAGAVVGLGDFGAQRPDGAPAPAPELTLVLHQEVTPGAESGHGVEFVEMVALGVQNGVGLVLDDRAHQCLLVLEVVVHLRAAHRGDRPDVFQRGVRDAVLGHQPRRDGDDPIARLPASFRQTHAGRILLNWIGQPTFFLPI
jgi:hypothetical protein